MKTCSSCKETKELSLFVKNKTRKDGYSAMCRVCTQEYSKAYRKENKEQIAQYNAFYKENNKERVKLLEKQWRQKHPQRCKEIFKNWKKNNKGKVNAETAKRHTAKMNRRPQWLSAEQLTEIKEFYVMAKELEKVFPWKQHVDHIVPLQGKTVSGLHVPWNLQIIPASWNISKGNRHE